MSVSDKLWDTPGTQGMRQIENPDSVRRRGRSRRGFEFF